MKRIILLICFTLAMLVNITPIFAEDNINYFKGEGETVAVHGILYVLNSDDRTATAIGSPTTETGYAEIKKRWKLC